MDQGPSTETHPGQDVPLIPIQIQANGFLVKPSSNDAKKSQSNEDTDLVTNLEKDSTVLDEKKSIDLQEKYFLINEIKLSPEKIDELLGPESDTW